MAHHKVQSPLMFYTPLLCMHNECSNQTELWIKNIFKNQYQLVYKHLINELNLRFIFIISFLNTKTDYSTLEKHAPLYLNSVHSYCLYTFQFVIWLHVTQVAN